MENGWSKSKWFRAKPRWFFKRDREPLSLISTVESVQKRNAYFSKALFKLNFSTFVWIVLLWVSFFIALFSSLEKCFVTFVWILVRIHSHFGFIWGLVVSQSRFDQFLVSFCSHFWSSFAVGILFFTFWLLFAHFFVHIQVRRSSKSTFFARNLIFSFQCGVGKCCKTRGQCCGHRLHYPACATKQKDEE